MMCSARLVLPFESPLLWRSLTFDHALHHAGCGTLGWVLNLGMFGWAGATVLTKLIFWVHILYIIILAAVACGFKDLPGEQWAWTLAAVVYALVGLVFHINTIDVAHACNVASGGEQYPYY